MKHTLLMILTLSAVMACGCHTATRKRAVAETADNAAASAAARVVKRYGVRTVAVYPHSTDAYTQGLLMADGKLYEGTGLNGRSQLRRIDLQSGEVEKRAELPRRYFGEGIALLGDKIYQITWTSGKAFVYDKASFARLSEFDYKGEGWGLTTDGSKLYMSDGSNRIIVRNPATFAAERTIEVRMAGKALSGLNELEWIDGEIWANVYTTDTIVRISPADGSVTGIIDLQGLQSPTDVSFDTDVLNGIAYDAPTGRILVTGKNWNKIYQIELTDDGN